MLFSTVLLFCSAIFSAVAAPTPASSLSRRQGDRQIISTIAPNYLVPLNQSHPDTVYGSQYTGDVSWTPNQNNEWTTIVGWDVPVVSGATECYIRFALPPKVGSFAWVVQGAGIMNFYHTSRPVNPATDSWNHRPDRLALQGTVTVQGGSEGGEASITGAHLDCAGIFGQRLDFEFVAAHIGSVQNRVETFQLDPTSNQGWFLEFAIGA